MKTKVIGDKDIERAVSETVQKTMMGRERSGFSFPSISDIFGVESDVPFLNYRGIFAKSEDPQLTAHTQAVEKARQSNVFASKMTGYMAQALPFLAPIWGGSFVNKPVSQRRSGGNIIKQMSEMPRYQALGLKSPMSAIDKLTPIQQLAELKQTPKTPIVPSYAVGDLSKQRVTLNTFKQNLGSASKYFLNRMENNRGVSAIHPNSKTGISMDFSTDCPKRQSACPYCYVEHGRKSKELFNMHGNDKAIVETPYRREILAMPKQLVGRLNSQGGMRANSFGDYRPVQDYNNWKLALDDAEAKGLYIKAITKQPELIQAFGDHPNFRANISIDALPREISNSPTIEEAKALKAGRENIKIRSVALNEKQAWEMAKNPDIDIVTLYHGMTGKNLKSIIKAQNQGLIDKVGEKTIDKEIGGWENMPPNSNAFKRLAKEYPEKICCQSGKCAGDKTKCGFGLGAAGGIIIGVLLPELGDDEDN